MFKCLLLVLGYVFFWLHLVWFKCFPQPPTHLSRKLRKGTARSTGNAKSSTRNSWFLEASRSATMSHFKSSRTRCMTLLTLQFHQFCRWHPTQYVWKPFINLGYAGSFAKRLVSPTDRTVQFFDQKVANPMWRICKLHHCGNPKNPYDQWKKGPWLFSVFLVSRRWNPTQV